MRLADSRLDTAQVETAWALLKAPVRLDPAWPALVAATALALSAVMFACVAVIAPPVQTEHVVRGAPD